jgi:hypothetical protein
MAKVAVRRIAADTARAGKNRFVGFISVLSEGMSLCRSHKSSWQSYATNDGKVPRLRPRANKNVQISAA